MTAAFAAALARFDRQLPGFASRWAGGRGARDPELLLPHSCGQQAGVTAALLQPASLSFRPPKLRSDEALLHAAETRTSAPLRIDRTAEGLESVSLPGLYPCGEGGWKQGGKAGTRALQQRQRQRQARVLASLRQGCSPSNHMSCCACCLQEPATQAASSPLLWTACGWAARLRQS